MQRIFNIHTSSFFPPLGQIFIHIAVQGFFVEHFTQLTPRLTLIAPGVAVVVLSLQNCSIGVDVLAQRLEMSRQISGGPEVGTVDVCTFNNNKIQNTDGCQRSECKSKNVFFFNFATKQKQKNLLNIFFHFTIF